MKCPKCDYLGFETGDRCKNCGYDFSLGSSHAVPPAPAAPAEPELLLREDRGFHSHLESPEVWLDRLDETVPAIDSGTIEPRLLAADFLDVSLSPPVLEAAALDASVAEDDLEDLAAPEARMELARPDPDRPSRLVGAAVPTVAEPALPFFAPGTVESDEPLIRVPRVPRAPLSVRRTPDSPGLRTVPKHLPRPEPTPEPALFPEPAIQAPVDLSPTFERPVSRVFNHAAPTDEPGPSGRRIAAVVLDHSLLLLIDVTIVYFTLRMAMLQAGDWALLPPAPMAAFLVLIKLAYFSAFTAIGGQTIGKMAVGLRVVTDGDRTPSGALAVRRTLAGLVTAVTFGLAYLPALFGDRLSLHDRLTHTRVVSV